jgi:hypothetical protein
MVPDPRLPLYYRIDENRKHQAREVKLKADSPSVPVEGPLPTSSMGIKREWPGHMEERPVASIDEFQTA